jgi:ATP-dependent Clp protease ATP-binding subunit ClpA
MKLTDLTSADACRSLKQQIDGRGTLDTLRLENCELLPGCSPAKATLVLYRTQGRYVAYLDRDVRYCGDNASMNRLCGKLNLTFSDFDEMKRFFEGLASDPPPTPDEGDDDNDSDGNGGDHTRAIGGNQDTYDVSKIVDMRKITVPQKTSKSPPSFQDIRKGLGRIIMGQEMAVDTIAHSTAMHLGKRNPKKPLSIVAYGPPGTGKTESAKALARILSKLGPQQYQEVLIDMNTYTEPHTVYRLLGSPPGYVGYEDRPVFESVVDNPYTIFLCDEMEKAHPDVIKVFMTILDEGRCSARAVLSNGSREYNFRHALFLFTTNLKLGETSKKTIGFAPADALEDIRHKNNAVEISYREDAPEKDSTELTKRIYRNTEAARKSFVDAGVLREIASRFSCFVEFKELSDEAKIRILAKQVVETASEYDVRLTYIAPSIMQGLVNASMTGDALTVRSFRSVIDGYLAAAFTDAGSKYEGKSVRLKGTIEAPVITP